MKNKKIVLMAGGGILGLVAVGIVIWQMGTIRTFLGGATGEVKPQGVRVANITANSATVSWQTAEPTIGQIEYGTTPGSFLLRATETAETTNHSVVLSPLLPETIYYFRLRAGEEVYDDNGAPYSFTTKESAAKVPLEISPAVSPVLPTSVPSSVTVEPTKSLSPSSSPTISPGEYTLDDFKRVFGTSNEEFDINRDGVVNSTDWILYQESR
ncbi:fibronectin type III domain-containing protein [Candidatus Shapirobacteria bacterium]|nr:fibronectin type III domain-containing protein [Candidatus Shapirobacteria bacterium]